MKKIQKILSTEKGVAATLLIGTNALYSLAGLLLYLILGPIFGLIPIVTGLVLTGTFIASRLSEIKKQQKENTYLTEKHEKDMKMNEEIKKSNTKEKTKPLPRKKYISILIEQNSKEEMQENSKNKAKVLIKK